MLIVGLVVVFEYLVQVIHCMIAGQEQCLSFKGAAKRH